MLNFTGAIRLGLRFVRGLRAQTGAAIEEEAARYLFATPEDLVHRCTLREDELETLASIGALGCFGRTRRAAIWQVARLAKPTPLLAQLPEASPLPKMTPRAEMLADYEGIQLTLGPHPVSYLRPALEARGVTPAARLLEKPNGAQVQTASSVIVRQRPGTAKGLLLLTLEDETGMSQAIVSPDLLRENRKLIVGSPAL